MQTGISIAAAADKERQLADWLSARGPVAIGFSGGVDSAYLTEVAVETLGSHRVLAVIGRSPSFPQSQWAAARQVAGHIGVEVLEVATNELADPRYAANPTNRCYYCKTELWSRVIPAAQMRGIATVVDGTNADDLHSHRPGARAGREHNVHSPLAEVALTKAEIRERSHVRGLPTWDVPSSPCLASRVPYGTPVTVGRLRRVEHAEAALRALGVHGDLRVRHHGVHARVELSADALAHWSRPEQADQLRRAVLDAGYEQVEIDPRGFRSGSLNELAVADRRAEAGALNVTASASVPRD